MPVPFLAARPSRLAWARTWVALACASSLGLAAQAPAPQPTEPSDAAAEIPLPQLAQRAGCAACHSVDRRVVETVDEDGDVQPQALPSVGPAWREVAQRYRGQPSAEQTLLRVVMQGSLPGRPHWQRSADQADRGPILGLAMPPQRLTLTEPQAAQLLRWILALPDQP